MKRLVSLCLTATFALVLLAAAPAEAMKPVVVDSVVFDPTVSVKDRYLTRQCGTAVWVTTRGHYTEKVYFDRLGAITRIVGHPSLRQTIFSERGGFSTPDVGVDKTIVQRRRRNGDRVWHRDSPESEGWSHGRWIVASGIRRTVREPSVV